MSQNSAEPTEDSSAESTSAEGDAEEVPTCVGAAEVDGGAGVEIPLFCHFFSFFFLSGK